MEAHFFSGTKMEAQCCSGPNIEAYFLVVPKWKHNVLVVATKLEGLFLNRWYATRIDISLHSQADW